MFLPKTVEDDWFLFLLGLTQVLAGVVMSQSDTVGVVLFCWVLSALWVLEPVRPAPRIAPRGPRGLGARDPTTRVAIDPYPGLFNLAFVFTTLRVAATALALGGLIFLLMPRSTSMGAARAGQVQARHLTGFDDQVRLGQMGEILENDQPRDDRRVLRRGRRAHRAERRAPLPGRVHGDLPRRAVASAGETPRGFPRPSHDPRGAAQDHPADQARAARQHDPVRPPPHARRPLRPASGPRPEPEGREPLPG